MARSRVGEVDGWAAADETAGKCCDEGVEVMDGVAYSLRW